MVDSAAAPKLSEEEMQMIYNWVDEIPFQGPNATSLVTFQTEVYIHFIVIYFSSGCRDS